MNLASYRQAFLKLDFMGITNLFCEDTNIVNIVQFMYPVMYLENQSS